MYCMCEGKGEAANKARSADDTSPARPLAADPCMGMEKHKGAPARLAQPTNAHMFPLALGTMRTIHSDLSAI